MVEFTAKAELLKIATESCLNEWQRRPTGRSRHTQNMNSVGSNPSVATDLVLKLSVIVL